MIASCSRNLLANFSRNLAKICWIEIACRNLKKSAKIAKVTGHFIATINKHPDEYRKNKKINKVSKCSDLKGKEGPIEVHDFCKIYMLLSRPFFFLSFLLFLRYLLLSLFRERGFAIFAKLADFSRPFFAFSLYGSWLLLNLLFLLFLRLC